MNKQRERDYFWPVIVVVCALVVVVVIFASIRQRALRCEQDGGVLVRDATLLGAVCVVPLPKEGR